MNTRLTCLDKFLMNDELTIELDKNLSKYSTMRLLSFGDLITVKNLHTLKNVVRTLTENKINYRIIGWGANVLLPEESKIPYLHLDFDFDKNILEQASNEYLLPASISLAILTAHANKFGLSGWEVFTGVPASLGGAVFMNAGTNLGEIGSVVTEVFIVNKFGEERMVIVDKNSFNYRKNNFIKDGDIIYQVRLKHFGQDEKISRKIREYLEMRTRTQPLKEWTCGCVFKNYENIDRGVTCRAGLFIDIMGLKGLTYKNLQVSLKHANFMENKGDSSYEDVLSLINILKSELKLQYGVSFETEVEFFSH
jgi:UDP-N-acetylmuramate dehydrogenase